MAESVSSGRRGRARGPEPASPEQSRRHAADPGGSGSMPPPGAPAWGGRKIRARLRAQGLVQVPAASTITDILRRHGLIDPEEADKHRAWRRFEAEAANDLWQMDFKGHFAIDQGRCHPLTVLDDHSRFALGLEACTDERGVTV